MRNSELQYIGIIIRNQGLFSAQSFQSDRQNPRHNFLFHDERFEPAPSCGCFAYWVNKEMYTVGLGISADTK